MKEREQRAELYRMEDAELVLVAYGTTARIAMTAVDMAREKGLKAGLVRPISLFPFPERIIRSTIRQSSAYLAVEMSMGQMVEDLRLAVNGERPVYFYGRTGGVVPTAEEILERIEILAGGYEGCA